MESKARSRSTGRFLVLAAAMLALALLSQQSWAAGFRGSAKSAFAPLEAQMMSLANTVERATSIFGDIASLRDQNQKLTAENQDLKRQLAEMNAAAYDNNELRQALDFQRSFGHRTVVTQVIGRGPDAFSRTLQIDRGSDEGVQAGMIVVSGAGLVGRVRETGPHGAIVQTLADPQSRANVFLSGSGLQGTVIGGPGALQVQIQHRVGAAPAKGEWAITSGIGGGYPRGLVVGEVVNVTHSDAATVDAALVDWVNNPATLTLVIVVTDFTPS
jgi:rod shape-determining protein MreC